MTATREHANCVEIPLQTPLSTKGSFAWSRPLDDPGYEELQSSAFVNLKVDYRYPSWCQYLGALGLVTTGSLLFFWVTMQLHLNLPTLVNALLLRAVLVAGGMYCCGNLFFSCSTFDVQLPREPLRLARNEFRALMGRESCTCFTVVFYIVGLLLQLTRGGATGAIFYILISLTAIAVLIPAWLLLQRMTPEPINPGLLLSMFWSGGLFSTNVAGIFNTLLMLKWNRDDHYCNLMLPVGTGWPRQPAPLDCVGRAWLQWILTPGIVEESLKAVCLLRLCTTVEQAARSYCLKRCPRSSENSNFVCCGWFYKLAPSPVSFVLCGMAVGAGFATMENVGYMEKMPDVATASVRLFSALLHICMTGMCSFTIAYGLFLGERLKWPIMLSGWLAMVVFHGTFDAACTFSAGLPDGLCVKGVQCDANIKTMFGSCFYCVLEPLSGEVVPLQPLGPLKVKEAHVYSTVAASAAQAVSSNASQAGLQDFIHRQMPPPWHRPWLPVTALADSEEVPANPCPRDESVYDCNDLAFVSWFPQGWPPFFVGCVIIVAFGVAACFGLPRMERRFRMKA